MPWDGRTMGELEVRGAYVASAYYRPEEDGGWFTPDGWFRTGDIASIDARGYLEIRDRTKDLIKSGGEWISSVALEGALMGHPGRRRGGGGRGAASQVARASARRGGAARRPDARPRRSSSRWLGERVSRLVAAGRRGLPSAIPRTSTGKFLKSALRAALRAPLRRRPEGLPVNPLLDLVGPAGHRPPRRLGLRAGEHAGRLRARGRTRAPMRSSSTSGSPGTGRPW